jgi:aminoglycoside phosphotransferase (APT) family kinase protein
VSIIELGSIIDESLAEQLAERATAAAGAPVTDVQPLTGGASSLTFTAACGGDRIVLKVAPPGLEPKHNRDVLRQARLLRALAHAVDVPVPGVLFEDPGDPNLFAMPFVGGDCSEPLLKLGPVPDAIEEIRARAFDAARVLAALQRVVPGAVGLDAEPVVGLADEVDRWTRAFGTVDAELSGAYERAAALLHRTVPPALPPVVTHGDYRLGNTLCSDGRVTAIIDWEIWSIGDPRVDLTWFLFFTDEAGHPMAPAGGPSGMPTAAELLDAYVDASGGQVKDLVWFDALTRYKEAAATALLVKRARRAGWDLEHAAPMLPQLVDEAIALLV